MAEIVLDHECARPDGLHQCIFVHQMAAILYQVTEDPESLRRNGDRLAGTQQKRLFRKQAEITKRITACPIVGHKKDNNSLTKKSQLTEEGLGGIARIVPRNLAPSNQRQTRHRWLSGAGHPLPQGSLPMLAEDAANLLDLNQT